MATKEKKSEVKREEAIEFINSQADVWKQFLSDNQYNVKDACGLMACLMTSVFSTIKRTQLLGFLLFFSEVLSEAFHAGIEFDENQEGN